MAEEEEERSASRRRQRIAEQRGGFSPSGRPLDYQGSQNWETRIATRTCYGAAVGALTGLGVGIYKKQNPFIWSTSMGGNWAIAMCVFCGFQELTREIRAADPDDWANCFLGGLASGALLGRVHGGPARALPMAVLFASVGTGINYGAHLIKEYRLQRLLASLPSEDAPVPAPSTERESKRSAWLDFELPEWFPIKKLDEEEAKRRYLERENQRHQRLESLQAGTFPAKDG